MLALVSRVLVLKTAVSGGNIGLKAWGFRLVLSDSWVPWGAICSSVRMTDSPNFARPEYKAKTNCWEPLHHPWTRKIAEIDAVAGPMLSG
jgi:hypothetical protein